MSVLSRLKGVQIDGRYWSLGLIALILVTAHLMLGVLEGLDRLVLCLAVCMVAEALVGRFVLGRWPNVTNAYITGQSLGILIRSLAWWPYVIGGLIAVLSKYVVRTRRGHLWNPSNLAICVLLISSPTTVNALSWQWTNSWEAVLIIWAVGSLIIWRLNRFHICISYVASFLVLALLRTVITGMPFLSEIAPITGPMYQLFIFFMITDPPTTLTTRRGRIVVASLVAVAETVLRLMEIANAPFYALAMVGPVSLLVELWWQKRKINIAVA